MRELRVRGALHRVPDGPRFALPAYAAFAARGRSEVLERALTLLRELCAAEGSGGG